MKTIYIKLISIFGIALSSISVSGCSDDFLTREPQDKLDAKTFFTSQDNAILAVNAIYNAALEPVKGRTYSIDFDCMSDNMYNYSRNQGTQEFGQGTQGASSTYSLNFWSRQYKGISRANLVLEWLDECYKTNQPSVNIRERLRGEALFLRAYFYSELVDFWGDVPYYDSSVTIADGQPRKKKSEIVELILKDLEKAAAKLPVRYSQNDTGRATRGAALALKGKVELYNGMYLQAAATLKEVEELADRDENGNYSGGLRYDIYPLYREMFLPQHEDNCEVVFDIQYIPGASIQGLSHQLYTYTYVWNSYCPTLSLVSDYYTKGGYPVTYDSSTGAWNSDDPEFNPASPFSGRDPRLDASVIMPGSDDGRGKIFVPWATTHPTAMKIRKWNDYTETVMNNSEHNIILIRFADVLLMRAEALVESGDYSETEVYGLIDRVRRRPSVKMPKVSDREGSGLSRSELINVIRHERRVEFAFEGTRVSDIRRWRIGPEVMTDAYGFENGPVRQSPAKYIPLKVDTRSFNPDRDYLWPIPQDELNNNPALGPGDQNPGY